MQSRFLLFLRSKTKKSTVIYEACRLCPLKNQEDCNFLLRFFCPMLWFMKEDSEEISEEIGSSPWLKIDSLLKKVLGQLLKKYYVKLKKKVNVLRKLSIF